MNGSAHRPIIDLHPDPQPSFDHDVYDVVSLWLIWMPLGVLAGAVLVGALAIMSPVLLPLWAWDTYTKRARRLRRQSLDRP